LLPISDGGEAQARRAQPLHYPVSRLVFLNRDHASHIMAERIPAIFLEQHIQDVH
jgi:hypothetical protein